MVSTVSPRQAEHSDDLYVVESPSLHERLGESRYSDRPPVAVRQSFSRRASRALLRYLIACGIGVAGTLAWQAYGDEAKQTVAAWGEQHGVPMAWLSSAEAAKPDAPPAQVPSVQATPESAPASSSDVQQLKTMTLGLGSTLGAMKERIEQLAAAQQQAAVDVSKLQAAEQDIRQKISTLSTRPVAAPAPSKQQTTTAPRPLAPH